MLVEQLPYIKELVTEKLGSSARGAIEHEDICKRASDKIFKFMPLPIRLTISEAEFAALFWKNRQAIFANERAEEARIACEGPAVLIQLTEKEILQTIYSQIAEQRTVLDEIFNNLKILEERMQEKT